MRRGLHRHSGLAPLAILALLAILLTGGVGCSGAGAARSDDTGQVVIALTQVPSDVLCLRLTAAGDRTVTQLFDVMPGASSELSMSGLPLGNVTFSAEAFPSSCAEVGPSSSAAWVSDPVTAVLTSGAVTAVTLNMHRNGRAVVGVDFGDPACLADGTACTTAGQCCSGGCVSNVCAPSTCSDVQVPIDAEAFPSGTDLSEAFAAQGVHLSSDLILQVDPGTVVSNGSNFGGPGGGALWSDRGPTEGEQILQVRFDSPTDFVSIEARFPPVSSLQSQGVMEAQGSDGALLDVGVTPLLDDFGGPSSATLSVRHTNRDITSVRIFGRAPDDSLNDAYVLLAHLKFEHHTCSP